MPPVKKIMKILALAALLFMPSLAMADNLTPGTSILFAAPNAGVSYKIGSNGFTGQFICTSGGSITIADTAYNTNTAGILITLASTGGVVSTTPAVKTVTPGTGFVVLCASGDTGTYNFHLIQAAP